MATTEETPLDRLAQKATSWVGSISSLVVHTIFFILCFLFPIFGWSTLEQMLLVLTTVVSLEAIYLAIFIQMSVNKSQEQIEDIQEDLEDIQEDIEEIGEDIEEITEDIDEIQEDIQEINEEDENDEETAREKAKKAILKSNVQSNAVEIKSLKNMLKHLESELHLLKKERKH